MILLCVLAAARAEDTITLQDGTTLKGRITSEDAGAVFITDKDGEARGIEKARIKRIERVGGIEFRPAPSPGPEKAQAARPAPVKTGKTEEMRAAKAQALIQELRELGSPAAARRKAALERALDLKQEVGPLLLAMLHPKADTDEFTRIGVLRALARLVALAPLSDQAAQTLGWCAVNDAFPEVRREACCIARELRDDRIVREIVRLAAQEDGRLRRAGAQALREIDDHRVYLSIVRAVPSPAVTANVDRPAGMETPAYSLPVGPGGMKIPIFLPQAQVSGTATDLSSPAAEILKEAAGKDLGNLGYSWINWYREKSGDMTREERDTYREHRSIRERSGAP